MKISFNLLALTTGLLLSATSMAATHLQVCGPEGYELKCLPSSSLDMTLTSKAAYNVLVQTNCTMTEEKATFVTPLAGVDTYKCGAGNFAGISFQVFYEKASDEASVIVMY